MKTKVGNYETNWQRQRSLSTFQIWNYYCRYMIMDILKRHVVGWMITQIYREALAKRLIEDICEKQQIEPDQQLFSWYYKKCHHPGIGLMMPKKVCYGLAQKVNEGHFIVLLNAYGIPRNDLRARRLKPHALPKAAWINKPKSKFIESHLLTEVSHSY